MNFSTAKYAAVNSKVVHLASIVIASGFVLSALIHSPLAQAEVVQFPEEELATESVLPVFDQPSGVKNRNVSLAKRFELGVSAGYAMLEPFFNPVNIGGNISYHFNEEHGLNISASYFLPGTQSYADQLNNITTDGSGVRLEYAPAPKWLALANYQYTGYYGKMSFSKDYVMNLSLYGQIGAGAIAIGDVMKPVVDFGIGQKFYFSKNFGLRFDLRMLVYRGPDVLSKSLSTATSVQPAAGFEDKTIINAVLSAGAIFLLPNT